VRYLPLGDLLAIALPEDWRPGADLAAAEVANYANAPRGERTAVINSFGDKTWRALKPLLAVLNSHKCWYCDCHQNRSDNNVDHFRPKGEVFECPEHPGYWWLAFELSNFRFTCTFCNSRRNDDVGGTTGGKQNNFPVFGYRAMTPNDNWTHEEYVLLDPAAAFDVGLLTWRIDGMPDARYSEEQNNRWWMRAHVSIRAYHLRHHLLVKFRKRVYTTIRLAVRDGDRLFAAAIAGNYAAEVGLACIKDRLHELTRDEAECCTAAKLYLNEFRSSTDRPWLDAIP
jgi:hypothetical protein